MLDARFARLYALVAVAVLALWLACCLLGQQARQQRSEHIQALREAYVLRNLRTAAESYLATGLQLPQLEVLRGRGAGAAKLCRSDGN